MITESLLMNLAPQNKKLKLWVDALNVILPKYNIVTLGRVAAFLAQVAHESAGFAALVENMNYSADALMRIWPKRFDIKTAQQYARKPEKIANRAYANRMGNGDEVSGEGWKYRGRGLIQITGKENYTRLSKFLGKTLDETVTYCGTIEGAIESACFYWKTMGLNELADKGDMIAITKIINGGTLGLDDRLNKYKKCLAVLTGKKSV